MQTRQNGRGPEGKRHGKGHMRNHGWFHHSSEIVLHRSPRSHGKRWHSKSSPLDGGPIWVGPPVTDWRGWEKLGDVHAWGRTTRSRRNGANDKQCRTLVKWGQRQANKLNGTHGQSTLSRRMSSRRIVELSWTCTHAQLMIIVKYAAWPRIQLEGTPGAEQGQSTSAKRRDLPEELASKVNLTLLPSLEAETLKREPVSSSTRLLGRIIYFQIKKHLGGGCTQIHVTTKFGLKPRTVALCLTGTKYLEGRDKKSTTKCKSSETVPADKKKRHVNILGDDSSSDED